jgi:hypothetical protein
VKLIPLSRRDQLLLTTAGRKGCADICLAVKSEKRGEWKIVSDVFHSLKSQRPQPWGTYAKLTGYLIDNGFLEKSERMVGRSKFNLIRLTPLGEELVKFFVEAFHGKVEDLKHDEETP